MKHKNEHVSANLQKAGFLIATELVLLLLYFLLQFHGDSFGGYGSAFHLTYIALAAGISIIALIATFRNKCKVDLLLLFSFLCLVAMGAVVQLVGVSTLTDPYYYDNYTSFILLTYGTAFCICCIGFGIWKFIEFPQKRKASRLTHSDLQSISISCTLFLFLISLFFSGDYSTADFSLLKLTSSATLSFFIQLFACLYLACLFTNKLITPSKKVIFSLGLLFVLAIHYISIEYIVGLIFFFIVYLFFVIRYLPLKYSIAHVTIGIIGSALGVLLTFWYQIPDFAWYWDLDFLIYRVCTVFERIYLWIYPTAFALSKDAYQVLQAHVALLQGGLWGAADTTIWLLDGFGALTFSTVVLHFGLVFALIAMALILLFFWRCIVVTTSNEDTPIVSALCGVVGALALVQTIMSIMVCCGLLPILGIDMPFFSFSRPQMALQFLMAGFVLYHSNKWVDTAPATKTEKHTAPATPHQQDSLHIHAPSPTINIPLTDRDEAHLPAIDIPLTDEEAHLLAEKEARDSTAPHVSESVTSINITLHRTPAQPETPSTDTSKSSIHLKEAIKERTAFIRNKKQTLIGFFVCLLILCSIAWFGTQRVVNVTTSFGVSNLIELQERADTETALREAEIEAARAALAAQFESDTAEDALENSAATSDAFITFEDFVMSQIDASADLMLASLDEFYEGDTLAYAAYYLTLDSMTYGSFSGSGKQEALLIYSIEQTYHAIGFDRKLILLFDVESGTLLMQHSFGSDSSNVYILDSYYGASYILCTGNFVSQGIERGLAEFASLEGGQWTELEVPGEDADLRLRYTYNAQTGVLQVQELELTPIEEGGSNFYLALPVGDARYFDWNPFDEEFSEITVG